LNHLKREKGGEKRERKENLYFKRALILGKILKGVRLKAFASR